MVDQALAALDAECEALYSHTGRPSIPSEYLLRATLLQILYSVPRLRSFNGKHRLQRVRGK